MTTSPRHTRAAKGAPSKPASAAPLDHASLLEAVNRLMEPLAALAVGRGLLYATVEEILKRSFVEAARAAQPNAATRRLVSRISTATGLNRREITRLTQLDAPPEPTRHSPATQVFTRWLADPKLRTRQGEPVSLPRQGAAPSFDALARAVTSDVHPRSLLEELCRLGLARTEDDRVHLLHRSFVPKEDSNRMLGFLGSNVGDHLRAAVANVLSEVPPHPEQAVFADELSPVSMDEIGRIVRTQWQSLLTATVPEMHRLIEADRLAERGPNQRVRIGLYMYSEPMTHDSSPSDSSRVAPALPGARQRKKK